MTPSEGRELVADWRKSGLGPSEFCRNRGVTVNRLSYWRGKVQEVDFVELVVSETPRDDEARSASEGIEVMVGDVFVRFPDRPGMAEEILAALGRGSS